MPTLPPASSGRRARPRAAGFAAAVLAVTLPVGTLLCGTVGAAGAAGAHRMAAYGATSAQDGRLHRGCHDYTYGYRVSPPDADSWGLETFLVDPDGDTIASGGFLSGGDRKKGTGTFRFCRGTTSPGRFTIRAKLTYYTGWEKHAGWVDPTHFRLRRPKA
ncbi:hypothetical protein [Nocardioides sp. GY 10127]|uniref:hypothetical protein n=1 Tax=Nocardioides sp. GY 10127 TaxID=2569762 RepID=UPI0010A876E8|nr:hypothetical protein [Nocardioides sp. GY 10127]TIC85723.1 hypothetical protein E8D37_03725 [Nocardioides sp. GY 10127]